ncbi:MAG: hypothetical protein ACRDHL_08825, partial [Candidatus Promineifilaceae bacterium]
AFISALASAGALARGDPAGLPAALAADVRPRYEAVRAVQPDLFPKWANFADGSDAAAAPDWAEWLAELRRLLAQAAEVEAGAQPPEAEREPGTGAIGVGDVREAPPLPDERPGPVWGRRRLALAAAAALLVAAGLLLFQPWFSAEATPTPPPLTLQPEPTDGLPMATPTPSPGPAGELLGDLAPWLALAAGLAAAGLLWVLRLRPAGPALTEAPDRPQATLEVAPYEGGYSLSLSVDPPAGTPIAGAWELDARPEEPFAQVAERLEAAGAAGRLRALRAQLGQQAMILDLHPQSAAASAAPLEAWLAYALKSPADASPLEPLRQIRPLRLIASSAPAGRPWAQADYASLPARAAAGREVAYLIEDAWRSAGQALLSGEALPLARADLAGTDPAGPVRALHLVGGPVQARGESYWLTPSRSLATAFVDPAANQMAQTKQVAPRRPAASSDWEGQLLLADQIAANALSPLIILQAEPAEAWPPAEVAQRQAAELRAFAHSLAAAGAEAVLALPAVPYPTAAELIRLLA